MAAQRSLVFGTWCAVVGLLAGIAVSFNADGDGWEWFWVASTSAAFVCGAAAWRLLAERPSRERPIWGALAGGLAGLAAHYLTWYFQYVANNVCFWLTGGCTGSLGEPPADLLQAFVGSAGFTFFSLIVCGWLTVPIGVVLGLLFARRTRAARAGAG